MVNFIYIPACTHIIWHSTATGEPEMHHKHGTPARDPVSEIQSLSKQLADSLTGECCLVFSRPQVPSPAGGKESSRKQGFVFVLFFFFCLLVRSQKRSLTSRSHHRKILKLSLQPFTGTRIKGQFVYLILYCCPTPVEGNEMYWLVHLKGNFPCTKKQMSLGWW